MGARFDARAWAVWIAVAATLTMVIRNPLYTLILLLVARLVDAVCARREAEWNLPLWRLALVMLPLAILFNALFVHFGETVLLQLPASWPLVGGPVTLEAMVDGLESGLILLALLAFFLAFNRIVPVGALVRLAPRAFHDLGVVVLIALTYVPETGRHLQRIREAQAIRGHRLRSVRDWQPLLIPLLVGGMERALGLAETMVARGYGATTSERQSTKVLLAIAVSLLALLTGWLLLLWQQPLGWLLALIGAVVLSLLLWQAGRRVHYTRYRPRSWQPADTLLLASSLLAAGTLLLAGPLFYSPYPRISLPSFSPVAGLGLLLLAVPAVMELVGKEDDDQD